MKSAGKEKNQATGIPRAAIRRAHAGQIKIGNNSNYVVTNGFSRIASERLIKMKWSREPEVRALYESKHQCGACSFFARLNNNWGVCCHDRLRHYLETVYRLFTCPVITYEGWESHSFLTKDQLEEEKQAEEEQGKPCRYRGRRPPKTASSKTLK